MNDASIRPFDSIESTQEFIILLEGAIQDAIEELRVDRERASADEQGRRAEALDLALYKINQLGIYVGKSRRLLNDLRSIRRLLVNEREPADV